MSDREDRQKMLNEARGISKQKVITEAVEESIPKKLIDDLFNKKVLKPKKKVTKKKEVIIETTESVNDDSFFEEKELDKKMEVEDTVINE